ncbi:MAG: 23S rRNA (adenine(2503)-C(2))-methyltransferase RlmN [Clostridia bacterium]|nr:23S rRNA (adenine(2503)-C(2))-methyltransferase RlmN [Clostridia bacterium]
MNLLSYTLPELECRMAELGQPRYRAGQIFDQLHRGVAPCDMTNLPLALREQLTADYHLPGVSRKLVSALDGTIKYLFSLSDGNCVESVLMHYKHGVTICLSSQVGCRMGCAFCASTIGGKVRDLEAGELIGQILAAQADSGLRVGGIVLMGIGEPLDNYDNVLRFLRLVGDARGLNIGYRHISLSTCGLCDKIAQLAEEELPITLSISLHAPDDETRSALMPVNRKWGIDTLLSTCRDYWRKTGRRISFEYTLIAGENDSPAQAERLAERLNRGLRSRTETMPIHVNLIPVNPVGERQFSASDERSIKAFAAVLEKRGIRATVRRKLGSDIDASCGQLRRGEV